MFKISKANNFKINPGSSGLKISVSVSYSLPFGRENYKISGIVGAIVQNCTEYNYIDSII